ncbi:MULTISPECIES: hypothetical protein [unclassified Acinetobacter]|uniref:hypothetical protein n=1 Tax=unclassified Acinetobacter TaxID=196816 RepID=UPI00211EBF6C|nr:MULTISPECIES: hypothetical protein [unclassified Acinetobacter]UUS58281.1 hypothetical protein MST16_03505 [Acinetobacter sp. YH16040_T]
MKFTKEIKVQLERIFQDFKLTDPSSETKLDEKTVISISREDFPVESILLFTLHKICGFRTISRWDKMHWGIIFEYKGAVNLISSHKFGLRLYSERIADVEAIQKELINKLKKNIKFIEKNILNQYAENQVALNNFTIPNLFHKLSGQYYYFRDQSKKIFKKEIDNVIKNKDFSSMLNTFFAKRDLEQYAVYNSLAMIDSYFSRLEHILVLALPFSKNKKEYDIKKFIGEFWSKKYSEVFDLSNPNSKRIHDELTLIKEKYRNTFAHGGFEKKGQSFHFHLENYGVVPATMSDYKDSVHFNFIPLNESEFENICLFFDEVDNFFKENLEVAWMFCNSGLDLVMDDKSLSQLLKKAEDIDVFGDWLDSENEHLCNYINANY